MDIELGLTKRATDTQFAPLVALFAYYRQTELLKALETVSVPIKTRQFSPVSKLEQVLLSILSGCEHLGAGSDEELRWLLARNYHIVAKGTSNRRAEALAKQVKRWDAYQDAWLAEVAPPADFGRPVQVFVKKRLKNDEFVYSYYVSTLKLPSKGRFMTHYQDRGGAEVEQFRNDKGGLQLAARRKRSFAAQKTLILLTDLAHNLLADFHRQALVGSQFEPFGLKRIVRDLLQIPGRLVFEHSQLKRIELLTAHPHAKPLLICLEKYCLTD